MAELDLNLLRVFDALMDTRSVTKAAARLHLSVPATSRALGRLRTALADPVLVRAGRGLQPTPFALQAAARVKVLLHDADRLRHTDSEPADWQRTLTLRMNDGLTPVLAPRLVRRASREAPGVRLCFAAQDDKSADGLRDGTLDLDVGIELDSPSDVVSEPLFLDHFIAVVASDSPLGRQASLSLRDLAEHPHVSASRRGSARGPLDDALEAVGLARRVVAVVPTYAVGALMALDSGVIVLLPHLMTDHLIERGLPLRGYPIPAALPPAPIEQRWHRRVDADPAVMWLRGLLKSTVHTGRSPTPEPEAFRPPGS